MIDAPSTLAVLIANVTGSVRLHEKLGSAETARAVDRCLKRMERAISAFGGRTVKVVGSELMAVFETANEAYYAAIEMQQRVTDLPPVSGVALAIRVGFSHGPIDEGIGAVRGEAVNEAIYLAGLAKPGQVLTSPGARTTLSLALKKSTRNLGPSTASGKAQGMNVFEAMVPEGSPFSATVISSEPVGDADSPVARLCLRYADAVTILDEYKREIRIGRDAESDVVIHDRRASRHHATIESRGELFVLVDRSTNGTYLTFNGKPELLLRREECILRDKGLICFAAPSSSPDADFAYFELI